MKKGKLAILGVVCAAVVSFSGFVGWFATQLGFKNINIDNIKGYFHSIKEGKTEEYKANVKLEGKLKEIKKKFGEEVYNQQIAIREEIKSLPPDVDPNTPGLTETEKTVWEITANMRPNFVKNFNPVFDSEGVLTSGTYVTGINNMYRNSGVFLDLNTISINEEGLLEKGRGIYSLAGSVVAKLFLNKNTTLSIINSHINLENNMFIDFKKDIGLEENDELGQAVFENHLREKINKESQIDNKHLGTNYNDCDFLKFSYHLNNQGKPDTLSFFVRVKNPDESDTFINFVNVYLNTDKFSSMEDLIEKIDNGDTNIFDKHSSYTVGFEYIEWKEVINGYLQAIEEEKLLQATINSVEDEIIRLTEEGVLER